MYSPAGLQVNHHRRTTGGSCLNRKDISKCSGFMLRTEKTQKRGNQSEHRKDISHHISPSYNLTLSHHVPCPCLSPGPLRSAQLHFGSLRLSCGLAKAFFGRRGQRGQRGPKLHTHPNLPQSRNVMFNFSTYLGHTPRHGVLLEAQ